MGLNDTEKARVSKIVPLFETIEDLDHSGRNHGESYLSLPIAKRWIVSKNIIPRNYVRALIPTKMVDTCLLVGPSFKPSNS